MDEMDNDWIIDQWIGLFRTEKISGEIIGLCDNSSKRRILYVSYPDILLYSSGFAQCLLLRPEMTISCGERSLREYTGSPKDLRIWITGLPDECSSAFSEIKGKEDGGFCSVRGRIARILISEPCRPADGSGAVNTVIMTGSGDGIQMMDVRLRGDNESAEIFGKTLIFNGFRNDGGIFEVNSIESQDNIFAISFSDEEKEEILKASKEPHFFDELIAQIAPDEDITDDTRSALALQLFRGVAKELDTGEMMYNNIHILLVADHDIDPILESVDRLSPIGLHLSDNGQYGPIHFSARITEHDDGNRSVEVGAVTIASGGLLSYGDLNRLEDDDWYGLRYAANGGTDVKSLPSGHSFSFPADTELLCTIRSDGSEELPHGIDKIFHMIIPVRGTDRKDRKGSVDHDDRCRKAKYSEEFIRRYIAYARLNCDPKMQESAGESLISEYMSLRGMYEGVWTLHFFLLLYLAEASARSRLSDTVDGIDIARSRTILHNYLSRK